MSAYGLIKATSLAMRMDTITDLQRVNSARVSAGKTPINTYGPSVRRLENAVSLGLHETILIEIPKLERGVEFYWSIYDEISEKEKQLFRIKNPLLSY